MITFLIFLSLISLKIWLTLS